ncbi:ribonuclease D [Nocardioides sp.]|uniref:ribonuclease D n=1 Tax=Nocardioides sp. TaxID=35761 RepID=UPI00271821C9|nr:ribonuclease D [Nocardioides sp.]MDO9456860.1 ribonuclease D [Nocardioides sp.]
MTSHPDQQDPATEPVEPEATEAVEPEAAEPEVVEPLADLLTLADGVPPVVETEAALAEVCADLAAGTGPVAIDAERASGYRYSGRAYLIQLRRNGSHTALIDPIAFESLAPLAEVLEGTEWILHAATQDLPCLNEIGLYPTALFDTELAGRLLGYPRVGLATLVETLLGFRMKKEHSAADWSTRPLPHAWLEYAALDVEVLVELRDRLAAELEETGKAEWARQEFDALRSFQPTPRTDAWRRTSGLHRVRGRRALGAVKALWETRDELAARRDVTPGRIIPDSAIVAAAVAMPTDRAALQEVKGFHGRGADRYGARWVEALEEVAALEEDDLPTRSPRGDGPPPPRAWAEKDPVAAVRLQLAREAVMALAEQQNLPVENLLTPDTLRRTLWSPPATRDPGDLLDRTVDQLTSMGARPWQVALTAPVIVTAVLQADEQVAAKAAEKAAARAAAALADDDDPDADETDPQEVGESDSDGDGV